MMNRIFIFILVLIILLILYLLLFNNRHNYHHRHHNNVHTINNNIDSNFNQNSNDININTTNENNIELNDDIQGYENEIMYISDDLKDGSYINQFKEIDYSKMSISNNQIGFNPEPKCSSGPLPFVDVNVNYLLNEK